MTRVLVTGASGYVGTHLVEALCASDRTEIVVGLDARTSPLEHPRYLHMQKDIREPLDELMRSHRIETVVHLAYVLAPMHDKSQMEDINLRGATNVLESCARAGAAHLLCASSTTVYGFHPDNEVPLTEDSPLRANGDCTYAENKARIEGMLRQFDRDHAETCVTILRPCFVIGPGASNPLLAHLQKKFVFLPWRTCPYQFVHVRDLTAVMMHFLAHRRGGLYNVTGEGTIRLEEMIKRLGNFRLGTHWPVMYAVNHLAWRLRLSFITQVPSPHLKMLRHPWLASADKLRADTGYEFEYNSRSAFEDFAQAAKDSD